MRKIRIGKIEFEHFQGFTQKTVDFQYCNAKARGRNGSGKTSIADGVFWVLYDKNSAGDKNFGIRPVCTEENSPKFCEPIRGLIVKVVVNLCIDGRVMQFKKEQHEVVKEINGRTIYSYPNFYWIDGFALLENKYKKAISDIMPTDIFKMLADLDYINNDDKCKWPERREVLKDMSGKLPEPAGHDGLIAKCKGHSLDEFKKTLTDQKTLYEKERHDNGVLISDKRKYIKDNAQTAGDSEVELLAKRENAQEDIAELDKDIKELRGKEKDRQAAYTKINDLNGKLVHQENVIRNSYGPLDQLNDERAKLEQAHADKTQELVNLQRLIQQANSAVDSADNQIQTSLALLAEIKAEYKKAKEKPADDKCYTCGQKLPAEQIADAENKRQTALGNIEARGNRVVSQINDTKAKKAALQDELNKLIAEEKTLVEELKTAQVAKDKRLAEITEAIKNRPQADPADDAEWRRITAEITAIKAELGEPVSERLDKLNTDRDAKAEIIAEINKALARFDTIAETKTRVAELDSREKELAQLIADINAELDEIKQYKVTQSKLIEAAVNGKFEHVTWRLFEYFQNGEINENICVCLLDGKPYPTLSFGEKAFANNDVVNGLSDYYGVEVFRFIEEAGVITLPIESDSQVIELEAVVGIDELEIMLEVEAEVAGERKASVA